MVSTRAAPTTRPRSCRWICSWVWARHRAGQVARPRTSCGRQAAPAITPTTGTPTCASSAARGACAWSTARTSCSTRAAPTTRPCSCWWICSWAWRSASSWPGGQACASAAGARRRWRSRWPPARPRAHRAQGGLVDLFGGGHQLACGTQ